MKIDKTSNKPTAGSVSSNAPAGKGKASSRPATQQGSTDVHLGATTLQLHSMSETIASSPLVDPQKVAEVKQAIDEGRFKVNSEVVADKLIETTGNLINNKG